MPKTATPQKRYFLFLPPVRGLVTVVICLILPLFGHSQLERITAHSTFAEKIYLQLDADVYTKNQTVWFKAVVVEASSHVPSAVSGVLHVELIDPHEQVVERKRIKLVNGVGDGAFMLQKRYDDGQFLVRAYTEWNKNFDKDFIFEQYISVFPAADEPKRDPIRVLYLDEKQPNSYWLNAQINPRLIDESHQKDLTVFLAIDQQRDTLLLKSARTGGYVLDYPVPPDARLATVDILTEGGFRYARTILVADDAWDVQFFGEGGDLVHGLPTKVGFKVLNTRGEGVNTSGVVMDNKGNTVVAFNSNMLGMGSFKMTPDSGLSYYAVLDSLPENSLPRRFPLPSVLAQGRVLSLEKKEDKIHVSLFSNRIETDSLSIQVTCRGILFYSIRGLIGDNGLSTTLSANSLPEGIIAFTVMDAAMQPVAERLFFNQRKDTRLKIDLSTDKPTYQNREKAELSVNVLDTDGMPVSADVSVMVMAKEHLGEQRSTRQNILTSLLLSSELRGEVEQPGYYFQGDESERFGDIDALLLTQGWRRYKYDRPLQDTFAFQNEPLPYVSGQVNGIFGNRKQPNVSLTMMTFGQSNAVFVDETDSLGRFYFSIDDEYVDSLGVLIQSANQKGKNREYRISLSERHPPAIQYLQRRRVEKVDSVRSFLVERRQERVQREQAYQSEVEGILIEEVLVEGRRLSPEQQKVTDRYGEPDVIIDGKAIQDKEQKWSYGLYSVLLFNFPRDLRITRVDGPGGYLRAEVIGATPTLVVVDGIPVPKHSYGLIPDIPPSEVKSVELIRFAKNFIPLYMEYDPLVIPLNIPPVGSVIAIYTHAGKGVFGVRKPPGLLQAQVPVYSPKVEFYAPKYDRKEPEEVGKPDLRTLIHWSPRLVTDEHGKVSTSYYHGDISGETVVVIEAISVAGEVGYRELLYDVKVEP